MPIVPPTGFDDETVAWGYLSPGHLEGEPAVPLPEGPPGPEIPANVPTRLPSGVVAYRETLAHRRSMDALEQQAQAALQASRQAFMDAQMLDHMSRVARSTRDIEIARRSIDAMGLQRDIQSGIPMHEAVARHPLALGGGYGPALRATAPAQQPKWVPPNDGAPGYVLDPRGTPHFPPASSMEPNALPTQATPITDPSGRVLGYRAPTGPRSGTVLDRIPVAGSMPADKRMTITELGRELRAVEKSIADNSIYANSPSVKAKMVEWDKRRSELRQQLSTLLPNAYPPIVPPPGITGRINPLPLSKSELKVGQLYDTKRGVGRWNGEKFDPVETK